MNYVAVLARQSNMEMSCTKKFRLFYFAGEDDNNRNIQKTIG